MEPDPKPIRKLVVLEQDPPPESPFVAKVLHETVKKTGKIRPQSPRAKKRHRQMALVKQIEDLVQGLGPHQKEAIDGLVGQMEALRPVTFQGKITEWVPDEKIRHMAYIAILEWLHGKPRELQVQFRGDYDDLQKMLAERIAHSRAAQDSLHNTVLGKEIIKELPDAAKGDGHSLQSGQK
jgi:hypothetical protein